MSGMIMLRIVKVKKTKRGFTLLETLLSVALLVIISSMLMNGFMSTINYSHNTSVYAKSASTNYKKAMSDLAYYATTSLSNKKTAYSALDAETVDGSITFSGAGVAGVGLILNSDNKLKVKVFQQTQNNTDLNDNLGLSSFAEDYSASDDTYADNRYSYTYIPTVNKASDGSHVGEIRIYIKNDDGSYYWGYKGDDGTVNILDKVTNDVAADDDD